MPFVYEKGGVRIDPDSLDGKIAIIHNPPHILVSLPPEEYKTALAAGVHGDEVYLPQSGQVYPISVSSSNYPLGSGRG